MKTAYINGFILDGTADMQPRRETVIVENGKITDLLPAGALLPADCRITDLQGGFLMPGLINMHVMCTSTRAASPPQRRKSRRTMCALLSLPPPIL